MSDAAHQAGASEAPKAAAYHPRQKLRLHLAEDLRDAIEAGDLDAARVAHEALGRLLTDVTSRGSAAPEETSNRNGGDR